MPTANLVSFKDMVFNSSELARPEVYAKPVDGAATCDNKSPRLLPNTNDSGRISYGAACRILRTKQG